MQRMPSTRSRAATKCISEVPGLVKQTLTPPATRVRTRLSAPFIVPLPPEAFVALGADQPLFRPFVKGGWRIVQPAMAQSFLTATSERPNVSRGRGLRKRLDAASLLNQSQFFARKENEQGVCWSGCGHRTVGRRRSCAGADAGLRFLQ